MQCRTFVAYVSIYRYPLEYNYLSGVFAYYPHPGGQA